MTTLRSLIAAAKAENASDLHIEPGLAPMLRVRGQLRSIGEPVSPGLSLDWARDIIPPDEWAFFQTRRSFDLSKSIERVRCRINVLHTARGVGFAIRLLPPFTPTIESLNLNPDLKQLVQHQHGMILVSGPTGCGKSTTMAGLIQTINATEAKHIVTIENPIEYTFRPQRSFIRQREVGRDTPSFEQALLDSLREDPDVLMVGEMREPETMRLTLSAAETGHLVLATVHSANCAEALQRVVGAFPAEIQSNVAAQLADCLIGVISQRLQFRAGMNICVPECEVLKATLPIKNFIRNREFFKIISSIETGAEYGMWTFQRYRSWLEKRTGFQMPDLQNEPDEEIAPPSKASLPRVMPSTAPAAHPAETPPPPQADRAETGRIEIEETVVFEKILKK